MCVVAVLFFCFRRSCVFCWKSNFHRVVLISTRKIKECGVGVGTGVISAKKQQHRMEYHNVGIGECVEYFMLSEPEPGANVTRHERNQEDRCKILAIHVDDMTYLMRNSVANTFATFFSSHIHTHTVSPSL